MAIRVEMEQKYTNTRYGQLQNWTDYGQEYNFSHLAQNNMFAAREGKIAEELRGRRYAQAFVPHAYSRDVLASRHRHASPSRPFLPSRTSLAQLPDNSMSMTEAILRVIASKVCPSEKIPLFIKKVFRGFFSFLPRTLIQGYIYLRRYTQNFYHEIHRAHHLAKIYLACCVLSEKYRSDISLRNFELLQGWNIPLIEFNYLEGLVANRLEYNFDTTKEEQESAYEEICMRLDGRCRP